METNQEPGGATHNNNYHVNAQQQLRVYLANYLEHDALVTGATTGQMLDYIKVNHEQLYLQMLLPYGKLSMEDQQQRLLTLVGQALDTLQAWKLVVVDKVGKSRAGCEKASEVWRSAKVAANLDKYLKWLFGKGPDGLKDYALKKRRQYGHKGLMYDLDLNAAGRSATDDQAPDWSSNCTNEDTTEA